MRGLLSQPVCAWEVSTAGPPSANQGLSKLSRVSPDMVMLFAPFGRTPFSLCGTKEVTSQDESFIQSTEGFISESVNFKATLVEEN